MAKYLCITLFLYTFQFQTGAIKSAFRGVIHVELDSRFNSKLVRLKVFTSSMLTGPTKPFQFQTGAIKSQTPWWRSWRPYILFQFQTGAIKSCWVHTALYYWGLFQFQTGAIKSACEKDFQTEGTSFNSKLVRLKVTRTTMRQDALSSVSIPNWCD